MAYIKQLPEAHGPSAGVDTFGTLFERNPVPMWIYDPQSLRILRVNDAAVGRYGYSREEFTRLTLRDLRPAEELDTFEQVIRDDLERPVSRAGPQRHRTRDGEILSVQVVGYRSEYRGRPARMVMALDVTEQERAKQAVQASELKFSTAFHASPVPTVLMTLADRRFVEVNQSFLDTFGLERSAVIGRTLDDVGIRVAEEDRLAMHEALLRNEHLAEFELSYTTADGREGIGLVSGRCLSLNGTAQALVHVQDVTRERAAERIIRESEERFRTLMEQAADAFVLHDAAGTVWMVNREACRSLGYTEDEMIGMSITRFVVDADPARIIGERLACCPTGEALQLEGQHRRKDGTTFPVEVRVGWMQVDGQRLVLAIARDITERRRSEAALRESERRFRDLIEHATYGIGRTSFDGRFLEANPALVRMLGYETEEELRALDLARDVYVNPDERARLRAASREVDSSTGFETRWRRRDGAVMTVRLSGRTVRGPDGVPQSYEFIAEDVTERRFLETQLRQAQKMEAVGQLTGGITHDFNNILTVVLAHADLLLARLEGHDPALRDDVEELQRAARRGAELIRKLMAFSRSEQLEVRPTDLGALVTDTSRVLQRLLPATIDVRVDAAPGLPSVRADRGAVEQMLMNLATNARDAMETGGTLTIRTSRERLSRADEATRSWGAPGEYVCVAVCDTGCGMDERTRARIFEPFFTTKAAGRGTGLGMAMIYGLMKQHGGYVDVESAVGAGTTVRLYFPAHLADPAGGTEATQEPGEIPRGRETILLVEDEEGLRHAAERILQTLGYMVLRAEDGVEALRILEERQVGVDLVLADMIMPRLGGRELLRAIRDRGLGARMLLTSGYAPRELGGSGDDQPDVPFLKKPWTLAELARAVRDALDEGSARD